MYLLKIIILFFISYPICLRAMDLNQGSYFQRLKKVYGSFVQNIRQRLDEPKRFKQVQQWLDAGSSVQEEWQKKLEQQEAQLQNERQELLQITPGLRQSQIEEMERFKAECPLFDRQKAAAFKKEWAKKNEEEYSQFMAGISDELLWRNGLQRLVYRKAIEKGWYPPIFKIKQAYSKISQAGVRFRFDSWQEKYVPVLTASILFQSLSSGDQEAIIDHELTHIEHLDLEPIVKPFRDRYGERTASMVDLEKKYNHFRELRADQIPAIKSLEAAQRAKQLECHTIRELKGDNEFAINSHSHPSYEKRCKALQEIERLLKIEEELRKKRESAGTNFVQGGKRF